MCVRFNRQKVLGMYSAIVRWHGRLPYRGESDSEQALPG